MEVISNNFMPGDQRLIQQIVYELKSQGIFDHFRKECIADVDTKPAYQNLRQRVEGNVTTFLNQQTWSSDMNKNQIREQLKKSIHDSGFLDSGVERIVEQVVNPKINTVFLPKVEDVVYRYLGIAKPEKEPVKSVNVDVIDLLPTDLEAVSPDSSHVEKNDSIDENSIKIDNSGTNMDNSTTKLDEDESPPFEALENRPNILTHNENSVDSHISGFSGIRSHENSNQGSDTKVCQMDISSMDSQTSQNSTESRLSIITSDEMKIEISDDSQTRMEKSSDFTINNEMSNGTPMEVFPGITVETENIVEEYKNTETNKKECEIEIPNQKDQNTKFDEKKSHDKKTDEKRIENDGKDEKRIENDRKDDRKSRSSDKHGSRNRRDVKHSKSDKDRSKIKHNSSSSKEKDLSVTSTSKEKETSSSSSTSSTKEKNREVSSSSKSKELSSPTKDKTKSKDRKDSKSSSGSKDKEKHHRDKNMDKIDKGKIKTHEEREKTDKSREKHSKEKQDKVKSEKDKSNKDKSLKEKSDKSGKEKYEKYDKDKSEKPVKIKSEKTEYEKEKSDKDKSDKVKEKLDKEKSDLDRPNKEKSDKKKERHEKDKPKNSSSSSGKLSSSSSKEKSSSSSSKKDKDKISSDNKEKSKSSNSDSKLKRSDSKTISGEVKSENSDNKSHKNSSKLNTSDSKSKHQKDEKHSRSTSSSKHGKDKKRDKQSKDDHYSSRDKKDDRRSTDRDSNDGSSNRQSTSSSYVEKKSSTSHNCTVESNSFSGSGGTDSGNSDQADNNTVTTSSNVHEKVLNEIPAVFNEGQKLKYVKPKFASNFQEAIKIMKIRKQIAKLERQNQLSLSEITLQKPVQNGFGDEKETKTDEQVEKLEQQNRTITPVNCSSPKKLKITPIKTTNLSKENWEALEARLAQEMSNVNYNSYDLYDDYDYSNSEIVVSPIKNVVISVEESKKIEAEEERNITTISKEVESITEKSKQENKMDKFAQDSVEEIVECDNLDSVDQIVESDNFDNLEHTSNAIVKDSFEKQKHLSKEENQKQETVEDQKQETVEDQKQETVEESKGEDQKQERVKEVIGCAKSEITRETANEDILFYPKADSPCRYLEKQSPSLEQRLQFLHDFVSKLERELEMCQKSFQNNFSNMASGASKRKREDYVVMTNNNKADYEQSTEVKNRLRPPNTAISKANKDKTNQSADVIPNEGFSLPLSPESDISNDKKEEELTKPVKRRKVAGKGVAQRYSSEDLYKPRPTFTGTRRTRSAKNFE